MAYLKLKEYHRAILDCDCAIKISSNNSNNNSNNNENNPTPHIKSYLRRAAALNALGRHRQALEDLQFALSWEPNK